MTVAPELPEVAKLSGQQRRDVDQAALDLATVQTQLESGPSGLLRHLARRQLIESLATLDPLVARRPDLVPARRRFLTAENALRRQAVDAALRHLDARLVMLEVGHVHDLIGPETPMVLHGIIEAVDAGEVHSNAGLVRLTDVSYADAFAVFTPPPGAICSGLLDQIVQRANRGPRQNDHPLELAAWLVVCLLLVHPFVDGNGRTARCLFQLVHSAGLDSFDWVSMERWASDRKRYIATLAGLSAPSAGGWFPERIDVSPFLRYSAEMFVEGVELHHRRADWLERVWGASELASLSEPERSAAVVVAIDRSVSRAELGGVVGAEPVAELIRSLIGRGLVKWSARGLQPTARMTAVCERAL